MKRLISLMLSLALMLALATPAFAASGTITAQQAADALHEMGLFNGTGTDANGRPVYDLDRAPTRHEAITMLVRLLGKTYEAESGTWPIPFTDVAEWAKPYVGYAYANGLAGGTSATSFSGNQTVTATQYLTFVLRALGYESGTDFQWDRAWELSDRIGLTNGQYHAGTGSFTRGDAAIVSYQSLNIPHKGQSQTESSSTPSSTPSSTDTNISNVNILQGGTWRGINETESAEYMEFYKFTDTTYSCAYAVLDKNDDSIIYFMGYEKGTFSISNDTLKAVRLEEYIYTGNGSQTQVSREIESREYALFVLDDEDDELELINWMTLNNWIYIKDPTLEEDSNQMYEIIKNRVMEFVAPEPSAGVSAGNNTSLPESPSTSVGSRLITVEDANQIIQNQNRVCQIAGNNAPLCIEALLNIKNALTYLTSRPEASGLYVIAAKTAFAELMLGEIQSKQLCEKSIEICNKYNFDETRQLKQKLEAISSICQKKIDLFNENNELDFTTAAGLSRSSQIFSEITAATKQETTLANEINAMIPNLPVDGVLRQ